MSKSGKPQILYIHEADGDPQYWQSLLTKAGYDVHLAIDAHVAKRMADDGTYDLILLNDDAPGSNKLHVLKSATTDDDGPAAIMIAGQSEAATVHAAYELGIQHFIVKDAERYYVNQLPAAMHHAIKQKKLIRELARQKEETQRLNRSLMLLNQVAQLLTSTLELTEVSNQLVTTIAELTNAEGSTVWLFDQTEKEQLHCISACTSGQLVPPDTLTLPSSDGIAGWVATHGVSAFVSDVSQDSRFSPTADNVLNFSTRSLIAVPLISRDEILGVLQLVNTQRDANDENIQSLVETLAASAAIAIENALLIETLRTQNDALEQQNADLDAYSGTVAHDLKSPITHFLSYADDLHEHHREMSVAEIENHLRVILYQSRRMNAIIDELLLLARVRMTEEVDIDTLDMESIVFIVLKRLEFEMEDSGAQISLPDEWPEAVGYGPWIEGVWYNYLSNGIKYGGSPPKLTLGGHRDEYGMIQFWVRDSGDGLTEEEQARLFYPFPKLKSKGKEGHGLGLVIVKRIAERLNGSVAVESAPGTGSKFSFSLPAANKDISQ